MVDCIANRGRLADSGREQNAAGGGDPPPAAEDAAGDGGAADWSERARPVMVASRAFGEVVERKAGRQPRGVLRGWHAGC